MADHEEINRYGVEFVLSVGARRTLEWLEDQLDVWSRVPLSEWREGEQGAVLPGIEFLRDYARDALEQSQTEFDPLRDFVTGAPEEDREERERGRRRSLQDVEREKARRREHIRVTLRGYLQEVVEVAEQFGMSGELPQLLDDVVNPQPTADMVSFDQLRLRRAQAALRADSRPPTNSLE